MNTHEHHFDVGPTQAVAIATGEIFQKENDPRRQQMLLFMKKFIRITIATENKAKKHDKKTK